MVPCFAPGPDNYVHRLVASKTDGKMVQYECEGDSCQDEKIDALQLEVMPVHHYVFTSLVRPAPRTTLHFVQKVWPFGS